MASGTINRPAYSRVITPTLIDTTHWEITQHNIREASGALVGSIILKCISNSTNPGEIVSLGVSLTAYAFLIGQVTSGQWDYSISRLTRIYFKTNGALSSGDSFTSGQYVTIGIHAGLNV